MFFTELNVLEKTFLTQSFASRSVCDYFHQLTLLVCKSLDTWGVGEREKYYWLFISAAAIMDIHKVYSLQCDKILYGLDKSLTLNLTD